MSSISYASAAKGQEDNDGQKVANLPEKIDHAAVEAGEEVKPSTDKEAKAPAVKKVLAPAPVPTTSAWGASAIPSSTSVNNIDEQRWPTPDKINAEAGPQKTQKFIKPITNKWVPIPAKVILPNSRSSQNKSRNRKKKQNSQKPKTKESEVQDDESKDVDSKQEAKDDEKDSDLTSQDGDESSNSESNQGKTSNGTASAQKPVKRFNNQQQGQQGVNGQSYRKYSIPGQQAGQVAQGQQIPVPPSPIQAQNGFFHPQPFNQFQPFNRQFRPNGQFRQGRNYRQQQQGYRNGPMGHPMHIHPHQFQQFQQQQFQQQQFHQQQQIQIPPPISPKQNPQEALVQQIDYYFSLENLIRDIYLRKNMNLEGWVSLALIINFKRIKIIINSVQNNLENEVDVDSIVLDAIQKCENLSINFINGKTIENATIDDVELRVKENFEQWLLPIEN